MLLGHCWDELTILTQIAKFMGPTWGTPGSCRPQMGPMLAPWTLLSGLMSHQPYIVPQFTWGSVDEIYEYPVFKWVAWVNEAMPARTTCHICSVLLVQILYFSFSGLPLRWRFPNHIRHDQRRILCSGGMEEKRSQEGRAALLVEIKSTNNGDNLWRFYIPYVHRSDKMTLILRLNVKKMRCIGCIMLP